MTLTGEEIDTPPLSCLCSVVFVCLYVCLWVCVCPLMAGLVAGLVAWLVGWWLGWRVGVVGGVGAGEPGCAATAWQCCPAYATPGYAGRSAALVIFVSLYLQKGARSSHSRTPAFELCLLHAFLSPLQGGWEGAFLCSPPRVQTKPCGCPVHVASFGWPLGQRIIRLVVLHDRPH